MPIIDATLSNPESKSALFASLGAWDRIMKVVTEYLWDAIKFEKMAEDSKDPALKSVLKNQAESYRELAVKRAKKLGVPLPAVSKAN